MGKWDSTMQCGVCGKNPESRVIIENRTYKDRVHRALLQFDFHYHHLIYKDGVNYLSDVGLDLCNDCHALQNGKNNITPINRFLRLMETTKRSDIKEWCRDELNKLRQSGKGRQKNTSWSSYLIAKEHGIIL